MKIIKAPNSYPVERPLVFLAGSIEMGAAVDWQTRVAEALKDSSGTILSPRREDWDSSWVQSFENAQFRQQVEWELKAMEDADLILMHFEPETKSPITLLEFGLWTGNLPQKLVVYCPIGFWRKGNVDIVCHWHQVHQVSSIEGLIHVTRNFVSRWKAH